MRDGSWRVLAVEAVMVPRAARANECLTDAPTSQMPARASASVASIRCCVTAAAALVGRRAVATPGESSECLGAAQPRLVSILRRRAVDALLGGLLGICRRVLTFSGGLLPLTSLLLGATGERPFRPAREAPAAVGVAWRDQALHGARPLQQWIGYVTACDGM